MRLLRRGVACVCALMLGAVPAVASADMRGVDVSNWQCNVDTGVLDADFVVTGVTWGTGGFDNTCLRNGVNQAANYQLERAVSSGKSIGVYHYALGRDPVAEADFYVDHVSRYIGRAVLVLDWESIDNPRFGNGAWVDSWVRRVHDRTHVWPIVYVQASALNQLSVFVRRHCGVWVAQYASNGLTGYQARPWRYGAYGEAMRQYTSNGYVSGYSGRLDLDYFRGERWQWDAYARGDGAKAVAPKPKAVAPKPKAVAPKPKAVAPKPNVSRETCVVVRRGDTLSGIAARTGLQPYQAWRGYRSGNSAVIYPGETVCYGGAVSVGSKPRSVRTYVVRRGDTLWKVFGGDWKRVASLNGLSNPGLIYPGQVLRY